MRRCGPFATKDGGIRSYLSGDAVCLEWTFMTNRYPNGTLKTKIPELVESPRRRVRAKEIQSSSAEL